MLKAQILDIVRKHPTPVIQKKADGSPVTELDIALSEFIEEKFTNETDLTFYSEEKFSSWKFPLLALDPLDGTREYILNRSEWAMSIGLFPESDFSKGEGWVFNPLTEECFDEAIPKSFQEKSIYRGEVSRSEWEQGLFKSVKETKLKIDPMGSIAYKLGRLSHGDCDFVVSLRPKNIWDVAGGTVLCQKAGMKFYSQGKEVKDVQKLYLPPLIWCHEELFSLLSQSFH